MKVVGRSGIEMDLDDEFAQGLLRDGTVRRVGDEPDADTSDGGTETGTEPSAAEVRAWAKDNDIDVPAKGKLPQDVVDAYKDAHR